MLPIPGEHFGPYEILAELGGGGMGIVYRAWDERLHREVAVKVLREDFQAPMMRRRFLLEARAASSLSHPHICTVFDLGEQNGEPFLVMELLQGQTLRDRIAQQACSAEEIVCWGEQIADALAAAHGRGIVHRDIKPANIFLQNNASGSGQVKVLDFGLAKVSLLSRTGRESRALDSTTAGFTVGTLAYMSPEQARGETLDLRSDLFSLGSVLYEMATRRTPFRAATTALVFQALLTAEPEPIRTWNASLPRELERIILRLLQKDRTRRFSNAQELKDALHQLAIRNEGDWLRKLARPIIPLVPAADPAPRRRRESTRARPVPPPAPVPETAPLESSAKQAAFDPNHLRPRRLPQREPAPKRLKTSSADFSAQSSRRAEEGPSPDASARAADACSPATVSAEAAEVAFPPAMSASSPPDPVPLQPVTGSPSPSSPPVGDPPSDGEVTPAPSRRRRSMPSSSRLAVNALSDPPALRRRSSGRVPTATTLEQPRPSLKPPSARAWWIAGGLVFAAFLAVLLFELSTGRLNQVVLAPQDTLFLGAASAPPDAPSLAAATDQALAFALQGHHRSRWLGVAAERAALHQLSPSAPPRAVAQQLGARAYLFPSIEPDGQGFRIRLDLLEVSSNDRLASITTTAPSSSGLLPAIAAAAAQLDQRLGDRSGDATLSAQAPLQDFGTTNLNALALYRQAESAAFDGELDRAAALYQQASTQAPDFAMPYIRLAWLDEQEGAELDAADQAQRALAAASHADPGLQLLARGTAEALALDDPARASETARHLAASYPADADSLLLLARTMRLGGHFAEALLSAEQASRQHPFNAHAYREAALAQVGLERPSEALKVLKNAKARGVRCGCAQDLAQYLLGAQPTSQTPAAQDPGDLIQHALLLDDSGHFDAGSTVAQTAATHLRAEPRLISAASLTLAHAALDRALAGRCTEAAPFAQNASLLAYGRHAAFSLALAETLCSRGTSQIATDANARLLESAHRGTLAAEVYTPILTGARLLTQHRYPEAAASLSSVASLRDALPLGLYLRALAQQGNHQMELARTEELEVAHRHGCALLAGSTVAPFAAAAAQTH